VDDSEHIGARCPESGRAEDDEVMARRVRAKDRRVERTERLLRDALASLIHEKPYPDIAVKEILARANVGRSTFYAHFRDKDELLASCMRDVFGAAHPERQPPPTSPRERVLGFSRRVFEYHERYQGRSELVSAEARAVIHAQLERLVAARITADLRASGAAGSAPALPSDLLARHIASTFGLVLGWWLDSGAVLAPRDVDVRFRALVAPALEAAGG
jgi:AcrR family transcriptional regulator